MLGNLADGVGVLFSSFRREFLWQIVTGGMDCVRRAIGSDSAAETLINMTGSAELQGYDRALVP